MNSKSKKILIGVVILLAIALIAIISVTAAYLSSRRKAEGYLNFASGLAIKYENVNETGSSQSFGNLLHFVDGDDDDQIDNGELQNLNLSDIQPGQAIIFANPKLTPKEGTASFALRAKLVLTDLSNPQNPVEYVKKEDVAELLTGENPLFGYGSLEFGENWEFNEVDNYHYFVYAGTEPILERLNEISYNSSVSIQESIYVFKGHSTNTDLVHCRIIDGEPIEEIPVKSLKIELYIEAIEFSSIEYWGA